MAKTVDAAFATLLQRITPTAVERGKASSHRASIKAKLDESFGLFRLFESGSFKHGTGVSGYSDVDIFASLKGTRPTRSSSTLAAVRAALLERFPNTYIHVSRPAVVCDFGAGYERVEIIPAFAKTKLDAGVMKFNIPGILSEWLESAPEAHLAYVNECNTKPGVSGGAKELARLVKAWKYYREVPISSFYIEMKAASYMAGEKSILYSVDVYDLLNGLLTDELSAMNDPTGATGRIYACSSDANKTDALSRLERAVGRAKNAIDYERAGNTAEGFRQWDLLFNGKFPAYY